MTGARQGRCCKRIAVADPYRSRERHPPHDPHASMPLHAIAGFWFLALALIAVPGPDQAFTLGVALDGRFVASAVGGLVVGYLGMTVVVATGLGALVAGTPAALAALTVVGGAYLIWLGIATLRKAGSAPPAQGPAPSTRRSTFRRGVGVSSLNPKGLLLFLAILPQFTDRSYAWPLALQLLVLGVVFALSCGVLYLAVGAVAAPVLEGRPRIAGATTRLAGIAMVAIGTALLLARALRL